MGNLLFLDIGGGELLVILLFVLIFFGSKGIPDVARNLGRAMRQMRDATAEVQREIEKGATEVKKGFEEQKRPVRAEPPEHSSPQERRSSMPVEEQAEAASPATPEPEPEAHAAGGEEDN